ncbi:hypothetical protein BLNAU_10316 [Blattamonas nauphoetae]|uniref:4Fe-4S ferredoxin-type domain-containing protein n=1 Tax=Blattamonas nauphoetae TaxID=2049346 RepID=A0ABQ9XT53_9EUKA|nr:hypothetical protein BLNAU_10316 [Blattamonas nauphoetae]
MKVVIVYFSNTGTTKYMAESIGKSFSDAGHSVQMQDGLLIVKALRQKENGKHSTNQVLSAYQTNLFQADVIGFGSFVNTMLPTIGVQEILSEKISPSHCFQNMKYYFSFSSHGSLSNPTCHVLADKIRRKNTTAVFLGSFDLRSRENHPALQPPRGTFDVVPSSSYQMLQKFSESLINHLNSPDISLTHHRIAFLPTFPQSIIKLMTGPIKINSDLCIGCYKCVEICPFNALSVPSKDGTEKIPSVSHLDCQRCARCFNTCPTRAIDFPRVGGCRREQSVYGQDTSKLKQNDLPSFPQLVSRFLSGLNWKCIAIPIVASSLIFVGWMIMKH